LFIFVKVNAASALSFNE